MAINSRRTSGRPFFCLLTFSLQKRMINLQTPSEIEAGDLSLVKKRSIRGRRISLFSRPKDQLGIIMISVAASKLHGILEP